MSPAALAVCDRCQFTFNHRDLRWQHQWAGTQLQNIRLLVCSRCEDVPAQQLRTIIIPPDPLPILNPRPEQYAVLVPSFIATESASFAGDDLTTEAGDPLIWEIENVPTPNQNNPVLYP